MSSVVRVGHGACVARRVFHFHAHGQLTVGQTRQVLVGDGHGAVCRHGVVGAFHQGDCRCARVLVVDHDAQYVAARFHARREGHVVRFVFVEVFITAIHERDAVLAATLLWICCVERGRVGHGACVARRVFHFHAHGQLTVGQTRQVLVGDGHGAVCRHGVVGAFHQGDCRCARVLVVDHDAQYVAARFHARREGHVVRFVFVEVFITAIHERDAVLAVTLLWICCVERGRVGHGACVARRVFHFHAHGQLTVGQTRQVLVGDGHGAVCRHGVVGAFHQG